MVCGKELIAKLSVEWGWVWLRFLWASVAFVALIWFVGRLPVLVVPFVPSLSTYIRGWGICRLREVQVGFYVMRHCCRNSLGNFLEFERKCTTGTARNLRPSRTDPANHYLHFSRGDGATWVMVRKWWSEWWQNDASLRIRQFVPSTTQKINVCPPSHNAKWPPAVAYFLLFCLDAVINR